MGDEAMKNIARTILLALAVAGQALCMSAAAKCQCAGSGVTAVTAGSGVTVGKTDLKPRPLFAGTGDNLSFALQFSPQLAAQFPGLTIYFTGDRVINLRDKSGSVTLDVLRDGTIFWSKPPGVTSATDAAVDFWQALAKLRPEFNDESSCQSRAFLKDQEIDACDRIITANDALEKSLTGEIRKLKGLDDLKQKAIQAFREKMCGPEPKDSDLRTLCAETVDWGDKQSDAGPPTIIMDAGAGTSALIVLHAKGHHGIIDLTTGGLPAWGGVGIFTFTAPDETYGVCEFTPIGTEDAPPYYGRVRQFSPLQYVYSVLPFGNLDPHRRYKWSYRCGPDPDAEP
jgi:hypothetical protein